MLKEDIKFSDSLVFEGMTSIRAIISGIDSGINDRRIDKIIFDVKRKHKIAKELGYLKAVSEKYGFQIIESNAEEIGSMTLGSSHGGIVAVCTDRTFPSIDAIKENNLKGAYAMIEGIEDPYNFGYALRSLYACGFEGIILGERNWMSAAGVVCRSSAGASEMFPIYRSDELRAVDYFRSKGFKIVCADERTDNVLGECALPCPLLLIVGGEKRGISRTVLELSDIRVRIPYARDFRASLSAASATTMFAFEIMRQNGKNK